MYRRGSDYIHGVGECHDTARPRSGDLPNQSASYCDTLVDNMGVDCTENLPRLDVWTVFSWCGKAKKTAATQQIGNFSAINTTLQSRPFHGGCADALIRRHDNQAPALLPVNRYRG